MAKTQQGEFDDRFRSFVPTVDGAERMSDLRTGFRDLAEVIRTSVPEGREQSLAITKLEEGLFWANAGIARVMNEEKRDGSAG